MSLENRLILTLAAPLAGTSLGACGVVEPADRLRLDAEARIEGDTVHYTLWVFNPTKSTIDLGSTCIRSGLRVYDVAPQGGRLRWDGTTLRWEACFQYLYPVASGERRPFSRLDAIQEILGDSLPEGPYQLNIATVFVENLSDPELSVGVFVLDP